MMAIFNGIMTGFLMFIFIGICLWAWSRHNEDSFNKMARLPLEDSNINKEMTDVNHDE